MKSWLYNLLELLILILLKIIELILNCFAFIWIVSTMPIINIIKAIKNDTKRN